LLEDETVAEIVVPREEVASAASVVVSDATPVAVDDDLNDNISLASSASLAICCSTCSLSALAAVGIVMS
jgi:hypothetical protein